MISPLQPFQVFITNALAVIQQDPDALGLAAGGSWASGEVDDYSDLDLVLVTKQKIAPDVVQMQAYAARLGNLLASFRGDHVGEPRLLIALYDASLLHVDIKFLTPDEFYHRVEDPVVLWERDETLTHSAIDGPLSPVRFSMGRGSVLDLGALRSVENRSG